MKRKTKKQRDAERFAAVLQRVADIYAGAMGESTPCIDDWCTDIGSIARVRWALQGRFGIAPDHHIFNNAYLSDFETPRQIAQRLVDLELDRPAKEEA